MKIISLDSSSVPDWAEFLPEEMITEMMRPESDIPILAAGVTFLREPQGAITWEEKEDEWLLRSIYIAPQSRRLGLGSALVSYVSEQMVDKDCEHLSVSYDPQEERKTLTPFLLYRKDRLRRSLELKKARTEAGTTSGRLLA